jgi:hypothetical protein
METEKISVEEFPEAAPFLRTIVEEMKDEQEKKEDAVIECDDEKDMMLATAPAMGFDPMTEHPVEGLAQGYVPPSNWAARTLLAQRVRQDYFTPEEQMNVFMRLPLPDNVKKSYLQNLAMGREYTVDDNDDKSPSHNKRKRGIYSFDVLME